MKHIKFLKTVGMNDSGCITKVHLETDNDIYYYDNCSRWCYLSKDELGSTFEFTGEDEDYEYDEDR